MDKEFLLELLENGVDENFIFEIAKAQGILLGKKESLAINHKKETIQDFTNNNIEKKEKEDNKNYDEELHEIQDIKSEVKENTLKEVSKIKKDILNKAIQLPEITNNINTKQTIFDYIRNAEKVFDIELKNAENFMFNKIDDFRKNTFLKDYHFFIVPLCVGKIQDLKIISDDLMKYIAFDGNNSIPYLGDSEQLDFEKLNLNYEKVMSEVYNQILSLLNINYLEKNNYDFNISKDRLTQKELKNPDFYKKFLTKSSINIESLEQTKDSKLNRFLKYQLENFYRTHKENMDSKSLSLLQYIIYTLMGEIQSKNYKLNLGQYKNYSSVLQKLYILNEKELEIYLYLLEKATEVYENWLFVKMCESFGNKGELEKLVYNIFSFKNGKVFYRNDLQKFGPYLDYDFKINNKKNPNKIEQEKNKINTFDLYDIFIENKLNYKDIIKILGKKQGEELKNIKKDTSIKLTINQIEKIYNEIKYKIGKYDKKLFDDDFGQYKGFLKEDHYELATKDVCSIKLGNIQKKFRGYEILLSFGGNTQHLAKTKNQDLIRKNNIYNFLDNFRNYKTDVFKTLSIQEDGLTPDYVLKIKKDGELIGSIILDAKFSKEYFLEEGISEFTNLDNFYKLKKYFSSDEVNNSYPTKIIILYPGTFTKNIFIEKLNNYFERSHNIIAIPIFIGEGIEGNFEYLEKYLIKYIDEIIKLKKD